MSQTFPGGGQRDIAKHIQIELANLFLYLESMDCHVDEHLYQCLVLVLLDIWHHYFSLPLQETLYFSNFQISAPTKKYLKQNSRCYLSEKWLCNAVVIWLNM